MLPVGLGALDDAAFGNVGEPIDARTRAEMLDESLAILEGLWSGEPFGFEGRHYRFGPMTFRPTPVQRPRIPIWVVGAWPAERSVRRALRFDGILPQTNDPERIRTLAAFVERERTAGPFDIVVEGTTPLDPGDASAAVRPVVRCRRDLVDRGRLERRDRGLAAATDRRRPPHGQRLTALRRLPTARPTRDGLRARSSATGSRLARA